MTRPGLCRPGASPGATFSISGSSGLMRMHAAKWFGLTSASGGTTSFHFSIAQGQRVWNGQPEGGFMGDGTSPCKTMRRRVDSATGSGTGTAEMSAFVYGIRGSR